ncbi:exopolysaccharide biosynthesis polyprenyl glycosylphosphotransferase [Parafannyhessea umbonata]|uniref:Exopolysaccharide biosynthesis polyprenyl glycosylphosphotransferase n=1 Tax=Parafannyhessea umbonata TaxID=604330 RepID=A0A1H9NC65_9ACTN|nr:exopolysaccharide biosynthesis polyprenyl glycosylphosphotransferase [Parafannyhessea umbonata]SER33259.1 exopolysaccharide biosynthesis polyprenyl glycosylphosphotransferase [Parafannyhessea umbonata]
MGSSYFRKLSLWLLDVICVVLSFWHATSIKALGPILSSTGSATGLTIITLVFLVTFFNFITHVNRGFMKRNATQEFGLVFLYNVYLVLGVALVMLAVEPDVSPSRTVVMLFFGIDVVVMCALRALSKLATRLVFGRESVRYHVLMIAEPTCREFVQKRFKTGSTYNVAGWLDLSGDFVQGKVGEKTIACRLESIPQHLAGKRIDDVFVAAPNATEDQVARLVDSAERLSASCHVQVVLPDPDIQGAHLDSFGEIPTVTYSSTGSKFYRYVGKRLFDILFSLAVIVVAFIPSLILSLVIYLQTKGSPFYTQSRVGLDGKHFDLLKFRSMVADANDVKKYLSAEQLREWETERKVENDPRVTKVGRILRKTSLDEFPQFINVFKGDMSVVGPRPIVDEELVNYGDRLSEFLSCKPGITGWWQVVARNDATYATGKRQELELYYVRHQSAQMDWSIIKRTVSAVIYGTGK